jgi:tetratricopeptide (TPR) repeat protein
MSAPSCDANGRSCFGPQALQTWFTCLRIQQHVLNADDAEIGTSLSMIGRTLGCMGQWSKALEHHEQAHLRLQRARGASHPFVVVVLSSIGQAHSNLCRHTEALECHYRVLEMRQALGLNHISVAYSLHQLGTVLSNIGQHSKAMECFERSGTFTSASRSWVPTTPT